jgi:NADPH:quinone reductase-like Zn-dependent oxidoreductase
VTRFGGYATHVVVPRHQVFSLPRGWNAVEAAGFPTVFLTAWYALRRLANVRAGERLLVHSAAGGVGGALLQIARAVGAEAVGVVGGAHKVEAAVKQGAAEVVLKTDDWRRRGPFDVVLDANGYATLRDSYAALAPGGRLVVYGFHSMLPRAGGRPSWGRLAWGWLRTPRFDPLDMTTSNRSVLAFNLSFLFHRADMLREALDELLGWADRGLLAPPPTRTFPLDAVAEAHRALESGATVGKLVLLT